MGFRVPRITIKVDFGADCSFGELSLISLGYGLHQAWIYSSMFDKSGIFGADALEASPFNDQLSLAYFISILTYGIALLLAAALDTRFTRAIRSTPVLAAAASLGSVGTALLLIPSGAGVPTEVAHVVSGLLTGLGSSTLLLAWGASFAQRDSTSIALNGAVSITVGFGIYGLVLHQMPFPAGGVASALIPFLELAMLVRLRATVARDFDNQPLMFNPLPVKRMPFVLRFGAPMLLLGVALGIMRQTSIEHVLPGASFANQSILFLTACCATVIILITFIALGGGDRWHVFFRPLIPLIALSAALIPFTSDGGSLLGTSAILTGYMVFEALMWIFFAEMSQRFRLSPVFVFGLGRGTMALAALAGSLLPLVTGTGTIPFVGENSPQLAFGDMGTVMLIVLCMMIAYALLPDEKEIAALTTLTPKARRRNADSGRNAFLVVNRPNDEGAGEGVAGAAGVGAGVAGAASAGASAGAGVAAEGATETLATDTATAAGTKTSASADTTAGALAANNAATDVTASTNDTSMATEAAVSTNADAAAASADTTADASVAATVDASVAATADASASTIAGAIADASTAAGAGARPPASKPLPADIFAPRGAQPQTQPASMQPASDDRAIFDSGTTFGAGAGAPSLTSADSRDSFGNSSETRQGRFRKRLETIANTYLLSRRETEVLYYLAHGYKSAAIQEKLYISEGTAKTHIRHIYRKLDIHSQQDLIHLIDEVEV